MNRLVLAVAPLALTWIAAPTFAANLNGPISLKDQPVSGAPPLRATFAATLATPGPAIHTARLRQPTLVAFSSPTPSPATSIIVGSPAPALAVAPGRAVSAAKYV